MAEPSDLVGPFLAEMLIEVVFSFLHDRASSAVGGDHRARSCT